MMNCASKDTTRFHLGHVVVHVENERTRIYATDGHVLGVFTLKDLNHGLSVGRYGIPREDISKLKVLGDEYILKPLDVNYPNIEQFFVKGKTFKCGEFKVGLALLEKCHKVLGKTAHNGVNFQVHDALSPITLTNCDLFLLCYPPIERLSTKQ